MKIAILGGTGDEGFGLGARWAVAGHEIIIGSRKAEKGARAAAELKELVPAAIVSGTDNLTAAQQGEIVVLSVPYAAQEATLDAIQAALPGKILVTVVAPSGEKLTRVWWPPSGLSAAEEAQQQIGAETPVVAAFQTVAAHKLADLDYEFDSDVLVCGDKAIHKQAAIQLCGDAGLRGVNAGALQNARAVEGMASVLVAINVINKAKDTGIRITGL